MSPVTGKISTDGVTNCLNSINENNGKSASFICVREMVKRQLVYSYYWVENIRVNLHRETAEAFPHAVYFFFFLKCGNCLCCHFMTNDIHQRLCDSAQQMTPLATSAYNFLCVANWRREEVVTSGRLPARQVSNADRKRRLTASR